MSLLGHLVPEWCPRDAATRALACILDLNTSPGIANAFVDLLGRVGLTPFQPARVEHDPSQTDDSRPDLTIRDADGSPRVAVEPTFWEGVNDTIWGQVGSRVLLVVSWAYVLDALRRAASDRAAVGRCPARRQGRSAYSDPPPDGCRTGSRDPRRNRANTQRGRRVPGGVSTGRVTDRVARLAWRTRQAAAAAVALVPCVARADTRFYLTTGLGLEAAPAVHLVSGDTDRPSRCDQFGNPAFAAIPGWYSVSG